MYAARSSRAPAPPPEDTAPSGTRECAGPCTVLCKRLRVYGVGGAGAGSLAGVVSGGGGASAGWVATVSLFFPLNS
jgi:hypothetical protein